MAVMMPREKWTDERLDDLQAEMRAGFAELRGELAAVHRQLVLVLTAFGVGVLGLLGAQTL